MILIQLGSHTRQRLLRVLSSPSPYSSRLHSLEQPAVPCQRGSGRGSDGGESRLCSQSFCLCRFRKVSKSRASGGLCERHLRRSQFLSSGFLCPRQRFKNSGKTQDQGAACLLKIIECFSPVVFKLECTSKSLGKVLKTQVSGPDARSSWFRRSGMRPQTFMSNTVPSDAAVAGPGATFRQILSPVCSHLSFSFPWLSYRSHYALSTIDPFRPSTPRSPGLPPLSSLTSSNSLPFPSFFLNK